MSGLDYAGLGFKAGLEIHQQLDTPKLFCRCPSRLDEDDRTDVRFTRALKPTASELGEVDPAAVAEARKRLVFAYAGSRDSACLVEMDEEPPHGMTPEALDVALETALLLEAKPVEEVHVMRKIVVDGSNTSGFQRTSLLATSGVVRSAAGDVRIATLCLEEDSARRLERKGDVQGYRLDRLGIPLVEIATEPDLKGPAHAREVAESIGLALRATGKVKRGLGTIRQDLNISIAQGSRVEIKGVQDLRLIETAVDWEVRRQSHLLDVKRELETRGARAEHYVADVVDVGAHFAASQAKSVKAARAEGGSVFAVRLPRLAGLLGKKGDEKLPPPRVGRELADHAKTKAGVKGIFHSDELPAYGITEEDVAAVRRALASGPQDAFALVVEKRPVAERALEAVVERAVVLLKGVPEETRDLEQDGTSRYLRPLPGGARMYPETDVPPVRLDATKVRAIRAALPELPDAKLARFATAYPDLSGEQARQLVRGGHADDFEALVAATGLAKETARLLLSSLPELEAAGFDPALATRAVLLDVLTALKDGAFAKEAAPQVLREAATRKVAALDAAKALGLTTADRDEVRRFIDALLDKEAALIERQGARATGPLMGPVMATFKGQLSGQELSALLHERLQAWMERRRGA